MKQIITTVIFCVLGLVFLTGTAQAQDSRANLMGLYTQGSAEKPKCDMVEKVQIYVNFQRENQVGLSEASKKMDEYLEKIATIAKDNGIEELEVQSYNYSVNNNNNNNRSSAAMCGDGEQEEIALDYQFYGNANYSILPESAAANFMKALAKNGFTANMNVNAYRQCQ